jgi:hypothetical protein
MTEHESRMANYQAAIEKLILATEMIRTAIAERAAAVAPWATLPPVGPPPRLKTTTEVTSMLLPPPDSSEPLASPSRRRVPTRMRDIEKLIRLLRAHNSRELTSGLTAGQVADDLTAESAEIETMREIQRYLGEFCEYMDAGMALIEDSLMPWALDVYHEVRRLSRLPGGSEYAPLVNRMKQELRAAQENPRGRRRTAGPVRDR